jgi:hypothetical protein
MNTGKHINGIMEEELNSHLLVPNPTQNDLLSLIIQFIFLSLKNRTTAFDT